MTFYERRLARAKEAAEKDGVTVVEWRRWERLTGDLVRSCGFKSGADVDRVAHRNGTFTD